MPKLTLRTLLITVAIGGVTIPAIAQVTRVTEPVNVPTRTIDADFVIADANEDGGLDRDEFVSFVVIKSDAGQTEFRNVVTSGEFDKEFAVHDHNADGKISAEEMGHTDTASEDVLEDGASDAGTVTETWSETPAEEVIEPEVAPEADPEYGSGAKP